MPGATVLYGSLGLIIRKCVSFGEASQAKPDRPVPLHRELCIV